MADEVSRIVGGTPLVRLDALSGEIGAEVFVKYEAGNPGGSIKDRAARSMVDRAEERGDIKVGKVNVDEQPELAGQFDVMSIPTLLVFENGKLVNRAVGARPKSGVLSLLG